ncbi:transcriptional regulator CtsR [Desulfonispora thiosulfatigenes DSM 11270]|uniref:Transcriptional regulator CtsR n=1 Tax=Desulfonispora thiosulfatigenes DSM 11270 TaxID=656914 RepID=A0A1W1UTR1_DESTI|nr:transcriptional regulator CtsR [Desulfonispora thiosulfatigenes DSM 11270]
MASMSEIIENYLKNLLEQARNGVIEIQRNELAQNFECVPSQINYVLGTRFTPVQGYLVETRRGGGGYIRIVRLRINTKENLQNLLEETIGDSINKKQLEGIMELLVREEILTKREAIILINVFNDTLVSENLKDMDKLRAHMLHIAISSALRIDL